MYTFKVVERDVEFAGHQMSCDVIRSDGKIVRSGMWPDYAEADCALLNEYCAQGWTAEQYLDERKVRMAAVRA